MTDEPADDRSPERALGQLIRISDVLLGPDGCPWDRSREPEDVKTTLLEETYEVLDAIERGEADALVEELGDLLYQIVFLTKLYEDRREINMQAVIERISEKLVRRHPHVFGDREAEQPEDGVSRWEEVKRREKRSTRAEDPGSEESVVLSGVPRTLPALLRAYRLTQKAASAGFDWEDRQPVLEKVREELDELEEALDESDDGAVRSELGDLLFACANLARELKMDPEDTLQEGNRKFIDRFTRIERQLRDEGRSLEDADRDELIERWRGLRDEGE